MNAYPFELVQHLYPCMLVAGISSPQPANKHTTEEESRGLDHESTKKVLEAQRGLNSAVNPQTQDTGGRDNSLLKPTQLFPQLTKDLCDIFVSRGKNTAWDPARGQSAVFHTSLVDFEVKLPPKKTRPTPRTLTSTSPEQQRQLSSLQPRSPLSPLHPSSSLFPNGLIAPVWLRKHRDIVPSVYVAFYCLAEATSSIQVATNSEDNPPTAQTSMPTPGEQLKAKDEVLIKAISERKVSLSERGVKLTVVLLTTRTMLESTNLEGRLSFIRRSSQLDSKASLFVLTPVSKNELGEFVTSLQRALFDPALDYYQEHFRRLRRKKSRYPPPSSTVTQILTAASEIRDHPIKDEPLSRDGWMARSDYKLGIFAELASNFDEALAHYTDAYQILSKDLLTSTLLLPPRTKRWAEAKVLADTVSCRISRLFLYGGDTDGAWHQFRMHIKRFTELSQGWGIGETTFEFWSWLGKQYRLMGDLLDLAMRDVQGLQLDPLSPALHFPPLPTYLLHPSHLPTPGMNGNVTGSFNPQHGDLATPNEAAVSSYVEPSAMCLGPGECYYLAASCALERWQRFRRMQWKGEQDDSRDTTDNPDNWTSMSISQERKIDHAGQAIDALSRAHELFKRQKRQHISLFVASKIAIAYMEAGRNELALRFLERIVKSYENIRWNGPFLSQLLLSLAANEHSDDLERRGRILWTLLGSQSLLDGRQQESALRLADQWINDKATSTDKKPLEVYYGDDQDTWKVESIFGRDTSDLDGSRIPFQLCVKMHPDSSLQGIDFDFLQLDFAEGIPSLRIESRDSENDGTSSLVQLKTVDLRESNSQVINVGTSVLSWAKSSCRIFQGALIPSRVGFVKMTGITLGKNKVITLRLGFNIAPSQELKFFQPHWVISTNPMKKVLLPYRDLPNSALVRHRTHNVKVQLDHDQVAYLDEKFPLTINVSNEDSVELDVRLSVQISSQISSPKDTASAWIGLNAEKLEAINTLSEQQLGWIKPGHSVSLLVFLSFQHSLTTRNVEVMAHTSEKHEGEGMNFHESETHQFVSIPVQQVFKGTFSAQWRLYRFLNSTRFHIPASSGRHDMDESSRYVEITSDELHAHAIGSESSSQVSAVAAINAALAILTSAINLLDVRVSLNPNSRHLRLLDKDLSLHSEQLVGEWSNGDRWGTVFDIEVSSENTAGVSIEDEHGLLRSTGNLEITWQRATSLASSKSVINISSVPLPLLLPPHLLSRIIVSVSTSISNQQPLVILLTIINPSKLPSDVFIALEDSQSDFEILSHRSFTVPNLLPRSTRSIPVHASIKEDPAEQDSALRALPRVRAWQRDRRQHTDQSVSEHEAGDPASNKEEDIPIINQRSGVGIPLDVILRYNNVSKSHVNSTAHTSPSKGDNLPSSNEERSKSNEQQSADLVQHLLLENQRLAQWSIYVM